MTGRDDDAAVEQSADQVARTRELRCERELRHAAAVEQPVEQLEIGIAAMLERVRAEPLRRQERPFEMRSRRCAAHFRSEAARATRRRSCSRRR